LSYGCFLLRTWTIGYNLVLARPKIRVLIEQQASGKVIQASVPP